MSEAQIPLPHFQLDGETAVLGIVGDPVAQVKAPGPLTGKFQAEGLNAVLVPLWVGAADLAAMLQALLRVRNFAGLIVTVPHKQSVLLPGMSLSPRVARSGAANLLRKVVIGGTISWEAELFDGLGFVQGLARQGFAVAGQQACVLGAGGAGTAISFALAEAGAARVRIFDTDAARASLLVDRLAGHGIAANRWDGQDLTGAALVVNATPQGMNANDEVPIAADSLHPGLWVAEVIMAPAMTKLLVQAEAKGCRIHMGKHMLQEQILLMADFFRPAILRTQSKAAAEPQA